MRFLIFIILVISSSCRLFTSDGEEYSPEIVFSAEDKNGTAQIYTMNEDGSNITKLTSWDRDSAQPSWSPDGKHILFSTFHQSSSIGPGLWYMDANGNNKKPLYFPEGATNPMEGNNARWSPDGQKVVFELCLNCQLSTNYDIFLFDSETTEIIKLTENQASETNPAWSPDGKKIAFVSNRDNSSESDVYILEIEDGNIDKITATGNAGRPIWHTIGSQLFYWSEENLYLIDLENFNSKRVSIEISDIMGFRPLTMTAFSEKILIHVFSYGDPNAKEAIQILNLNDGSMTSIYQGKGINGVDWIKN